MNNTKLEDTTMSKVTNRTACLMMTVLLLASLCNAAAGKTIYVDDATGVNNGSSWENAYFYLQDALADANSAEKPVEIWVAQGIYMPDHGAIQTPGDCEATFQLISGVLLKGGYAGLREPDPNARDVDLYETILSGDLNGDDAQVDVVEVADLKDLESEPTRMENSYHVVTGSGTDDSAVLDGFTITAGNANGPKGPKDDPYKFQSGAGMYNISGSLIVANCTFTMNAAFNGGGIFNYDCSLTLTGCGFTRNLATWGGGMNNHKCSLILTNCTFSENLARRGGGGICNKWPSTLKLSDCTFIRNLADFSGGGMHGGAATLTNCVFIANEALQGGGLFSGLLNLTNCSFIANKAKYWGGGMWSGSYNMSNCMLSGNSAGVSGGAIFIFCSDLILTNCTLTGNSAPKGNALSSDEFHGDSSNVEITNCIFWGSNNEIWNDTGLSTSITISYSDIQGGQAVVHDPCSAIVWGQGNIDTDPLFADPGYLVDVNDPNIVVEPSDPNNDLWVNGDYRLKSEAGRWDPNSESWVIDDVTSPCIDAGDPVTPVMCEPHPRGYFINMGAYGGTEQASKSPFNSPYELDSE